MVSGFSDYRSPVGMANENCRSVLHCKSSLGNCYVVLQRYRRILDDADVIAVLLQDFVNAFPACAVNKTTVNQNDVLHESCSLILTRFCFPANYSVEASLW